MATQIGTIKTLIGTATATAPDGVQRTLKVGDKVAQNELISTGVFGAIEIEFNDGAIMTLGRNSEAMLSDESFNFAETLQADILQRSDDEDVESIQQAILEGNDPTQITEATAAGAGVESSNEGVEFVQVDYENPETIPEAGFDTTGISFAFEEEFIDTGSNSNSDGSSQGTNVVPPVIVDPPVNIAPQVVSLDSQTLEDTTVTFSVGDLLSGASDQNQTDTLSIKNVTLASGDGELVDNGNGTWSYTPAANSDNDAIVNFDVTDGTVSVPNTVTIDVVAVADQPNIYISIGEGVAVKTFENLIVNGSFEDIAGENRNGQFIGDRNIYSGGLVKMKSITGWLTTEGAPMEPHHKLHAGVGTTDGDNYMDLGASPGNSSISQTIQLIAGAEYTLSVDYLDKAAKQESGISGQNSGVMQVIWNGVVVATIQGNNIDDWETLDNISLLGDISGSNTLTFSEVGDADDNWGMAIDNIQLFHVPYQYDVSIFTNLTDIDGSEVLGVVDVSSLPDGVTFDGTYLVSSTPLTDDQINQITASVSSTEASNGDQATTTVTAKLEFGALDASAETGDVLIKATSASENIIGGAGDDVIFGGAGDDVISGGLGADQFVWNDSDVGTAGSAAVDTLNDFNAAEGDVLNLSDLLSDSTENNTITGLEHNGHLELQIINGNDVIQKIDITSIAVANDAAAIDQLNTMLANGTINDGI